MSVKFDSTIGLLVPGKYLIGLTHANKSNFCLILTLIDLNPLPIGVVSGPLIETLYFFIASIVSCGKSSPHISIAC